MISRRSPAAYSPVVRRREPNGAIGRPGCRSSQTRLCAIAARSESGSPSSRSDGLVDGPEDPPPWARERAGTVRENPPPPGSRSPARPRTSRAGTASGGPTEATRGAERGGGWVSRLPWRSGASTAQRPPRSLASGAAGLPGAGPGPPSGTLTAGPAAARVGPAGSVEFGRAGPGFRQERPRTPVPGRASDAASSNPDRSRLPESRAPGAAWHPACNCAAGGSARCRRSV